MKHMIFLSAVLLLAAGCKTTEQEVQPTKALGWRDQQAYIKTVRDPRIFGMHLYQTSSGDISVRGGGRLHNWQVEALDMTAKEPLRPVVNLVGGFTQGWPVLIDLTQPNNILSYEVAAQLGAHAVGEGDDPIMLKMPDEEGIVACLSTMKAIRLGQLHVEHPLVYVRLATGSIGPLDRGITTPNLKGVIGWNALRQFEVVQFDYDLAKVILSTVDEEEYEPHPDFLVAALPLIKNAKGCAFRGKVDGKDMSILIDPAGDFEVAVPEGLSCSSIQIGDSFELTTPTVSASPYGVRLGARFLQKYLVTICPKRNILFLELVRDLEE